MSTLWSKVLEGFVAGYTTLETAGKWKKVNMEEEQAVVQITYWWTFGTEFSLTLMAKARPGKLEQPPFAGLTLVNLSPAVLTLKYWKPMPV